MNPSALTRAALAAAFCSFLAACGPGKPLPDEAKLAGKTVKDFPPAKVDVFAGMDAGVELTPEEIEGRNTWMLWTGGNERFWNLMSQEGYGLIDFLKLIDSRQRGDRFQRLGLINEPGYQSVAKADEFGLYIDQPVAGHPAGIDPEIYGLSTGIIGLRLFPNPEFDAKAKAKWDADKFYADLTYRTDPKLVRPYRVGMTCAICHVAPHPHFPPPDLENPEYKHLSATIGNQYFRNGEIFGFNLGKDDFLKQVLDSVLPGTVDTSIVATDYNNNPNIINGIFNTAERLRIAKPETVDGGALALPPGTASRPVPHVLVDGADSIGVTGALARVFVNIGTWSEEWIRCQNPIIGLRKQKELSIKGGFEQSVFWEATVEQCDNLAKYLVRAGQPIPLAEAPGGAAYLTEAPEVVDRGKLVFAENCFACHSSKQPEDGKDRPMEQFAVWSKDPAYLDWARSEVLKPDFLENNYLSIDERVPVTLVKTNAARALQDNALRGHVWGEFSSVDYKNTPSVGTIQVTDPFTGGEQPFEMRPGGPGFYRVPSLVAVWTSAPFLHNNALGNYNHDPSVKGRMEAFDDAIRKMMWPEKRDGLKSMAVATERCYFKLDPRHLPVLVKGVAGSWIGPFLAMPWLAPLAVCLPGAWLLARAGRRRGKAARWLSRGGGVLVLLLAVGLLFGNLFAAGKLGAPKLGPIPKGFPLSLLVNLDPELTKPAEVADAMGKLHRCFKQIEKDKLDDQQALALIGREAGPALLKVNKAPDFIRDRGHYFPAHLSDDDKEALIAWLKRM
jgi:hypothetical protein